MLVRRVAIVVAWLTLAVPASAQEIPPVATSSAGHVGVQVREGLRIAEPGRAFGPAGRVPSGEVALGRRGDAVVVWREPGRDSRLSVSYRPPGGPFEAPLRLDPDETVDGEGDAVAGIDASGTVVVAWVHGDRDSLAARVRDPANGWQPVQPLGGTNVYRPALVVSDGGTATLAWPQDVRRNVGEIVVATRRPGSPTFDRPAVVAPARFAGGEPKLAANDRGDAVVAWVRVRDGGRGGAQRTEFSVWGSFGKAGAFGPPRRLSPGRGMFPSVAVKPDSGMVFAWADNGRSVSARLRTPAGGMRRAYRLTRTPVRNTAPVALGHFIGAVAYVQRERSFSLLRVKRLGNDGRPQSFQTLHRVRDAFDFGSPLSFVESRVRLFYLRPDPEKQGPPSLQPVS